MGNNTVLINFKVSRAARTELSKQCATKNIKSSEVLRLLLDGYLQGTIKLPSKEY